MERRLANVCMETTTSLGKMPQDETFWLSSNETASFCPSTLNGHSGPSLVRFSWEHPLSTLSDSMVNTYSCHIDALGLSSLNSSPATWEQSWKRLCATRNAVPSWENFICPSCHRVWRSCFNSFPAPLQNHLIWNFDHINQSQQQL